VHDGIGGLTAQSVQLGSGKRYVTTKACRSGESSHRHSPVQWPEALIFRKQIGIDSRNERRTSSGHLCGLGIDFRRVFGERCAHSFSLGLDVSDGRFARSEEFVEWLDLFHQFEDLILQCRSTPDLRFQVGLERLRLLGRGHRGSIELRVNGCDLGGHHCDFILETSLLALQIGPALARFPQCQLLVGDDRGKPLQFCLLGQIRSPMSQLVGCSVVRLKFKEFVERTHHASFTHIGAFRSIVAMIRLRPPQLTIDHAAVWSSWWLKLWTAE